MARTTPIAYLPPTILDVGPSAPIKDQTWLDQTQRLHHLYARSGEHIPLFSGDEIMTTSLTFLRPGQLDGIVGTWRPRRVAEGDVYLLDLTIYGENINVRANVYDVALDSFIGTIDVGVPSGVGVAAWAATTFVGLAADVQTGGVPRLIALDLEMKANVAGEAKLYQAFASANVLTSGEMP